MENYICVRVLKHKLVPVDLGSVLYFLHALPVAVLVIPANSAVWVNHAEHKTVNT